MRQWPSNVSNLIIPLPLPPPSPLPNEPLPHYKLYIMWSLWPSNSPPAFLPTPSPRPPTPSPWLLSPSSWTWEELITDYKIRIS